MNFAEHLSDISLNYFALLRKLSSKYDLTLAQSLLILYVPFDGISVSDLSEKLGVDISTMTRNIQRIQKQGLIERKPNESDRRSIKLFLSNRGQKIVLLLNDDISNQLSSILSKYDFEQIEQIQHALESVGWNLYLNRKDL
ncbi:MAG: MarR family transcriptional regulator [Pelagibacteraceae bacterium TMED246]|nr:MAG: MarR family transcriptional regulator [Pelagibacteraceae bacterium TMED246]|tara:strand:+ start:54179 stop:54601 length:423 start_codon:yes stop_codon:yes gene_type:complete